MQTGTRRAALALLGAGVAGFALGSVPGGVRLPDPVDIAGFYQSPLTPPAAPLNVFHLGHSLVGRDMPAMLAQLAAPGHRYHSQLGWGTSLREHWHPDLAVEGFASENDHDRFRPARAAIGSGAYDTVVLTEMVELLDALKYHESGPYLTRWADLARAANPTTRVYLYETWHGLDDPVGFLARLDGDLERLWVGELLAHDLAHAPAPARPIHLIPAGQVMARLVRSVEADPRPSLARRDDLFARTSDGSRDPIHLNDIGAYMVAVTHFATLYHRSPMGLPHALLRADGTPATAPSPEAAALIQRLAWDVVRADPRTGVTG